MNIAKTPLPTCVMEISGLCVYSLMVAPLFSFGGNGDVIRKHLKFLTSAVFFKKPNAVGAACPAQSHAL